MVTDNWKLWERESFRLASELVMPRQFAGVAQEEQ